MISESVLQNRSKRKKVGASEGLILGSAANVKQGMYHCNYCSKDISNSVRIRCGTCLDFDLCLQCFSVGAEIVPHKKTHPYRLIGNLSFPLFDCSWGADEELLLLEALDNHGPGNWAAISDVVGTKDAQQCMQHYFDIFVQHQEYPLPKPTETIQSINLQEFAQEAKEKNYTSQDVKQALLLQQQAATPKVEPTVKTENDAKSSSQIQEETGQSLKRKREDEDQNKEKKVSTNYPIQQVVISHKPDVNAVDQTGYNRFRQEFDPEYDLEAEAIIGDLEFPSPQEELILGEQYQIDDSLKERLLQIYNRRQKVRKQRREDILQRKLCQKLQLIGGGQGGGGGGKQVGSGVAATTPLSTNHEPSKRSSQNFSGLDTGIKSALRVFMRYMSDDEYKELEDELLTEQRLKTRIIELQEQRRRGARTFQQGEEVSERLKREVERAMLETQPYCAPLPMPLPIVIKASKQNSINLATWQNSKEGVQSLHEAFHCCRSMKHLLEGEVQLCKELKLLPSFYLALKDSLLRECRRNGPMNRAEVRRYFRMDPNKCQKLHDLLVNQKSLPFVQKEKV